MSLACRILSMKQVCVLGCAAMVAASLASAQTASQSTSSTLNAGWSSSQSGQMQLAEGGTPSNPASAASSSALPAAPTPAGQDQDNTTYSGWHGHDIVHRLTIEAGGGASAPAGDKSDITWGYGLLFGGGVNITHNLAAFIEYQFLDNKVPGDIIAESGTTGGHYHIWSFTLAPQYDFFPKSSNDVYAVGGGGFYRKTTNFTVLSPTVFCQFYYCGVGYVPTTVGKLSSNQGGWNIGVGYQHRFGGMYGMSRTRVFAEVRYLDVLSPAVRGTSPSGGLGPVTISEDTKLLPITAGIRW